MRPPEEACGPTVGGSRWSLIRWEEDSEQEDKGHFDLFILFVHCEESSCQIVHKNSLAPSVELFVESNQNKSGFTW
jgi:hypothetical protein